MGVAGRLGPTEEYSHPSRPMFISSKPTIILVRSGATTHVPDNTYLLPRAFLSLGKALHHRAMGPAGRGQNAQEVRPSRGIYDDRRSYDARRHRTGQVSAEASWQRQDYRRRSFVRHASWPGNGSSKARTFL